MNRSIAWTIVGLVAFMLVGCGDSKKGHDVTSEVAPNVPAAPAKENKASPPAAAPLIGINIGGSDDADDATAKAAEPAKAAAKVAAAKAAGQPGVSAVGKTAEKAAQPAAKSGPPPVAIASAAAEPTDDDDAVDDDDPKAAKLAKRRRERKADKKADKQREKDRASGAPPPVAQGQPAPNNSADTPPSNLLGGIGFGQSGKFKDSAAPGLAPQSKATAIASQNAAGNSAKGSAVNPVVPMEPIKVSTPKDAVSAFSFQLLNRIQMRIAQQPGPSLLPAMLGGTGKPAPAAAAKAMAPASETARAPAIKLGGSEDDRIEQRRAKRKANREDR